MKTAEVFSKLEGDWQSTREKILLDNLLQKNSQTGANAVLKVARKRLKAMTPNQITTLLAVDYHQQAMLIFASVCKIHRFIYEFSVEVLREKALQMDMAISASDYQRFFDSKANEHPELEKLSVLSQKKVREVLFRMLSEVGLIKSTKEWFITPFILPSSVATALIQDNPSLLKAFLVSDSDIQRLVTK